jgi:formate hydrogenlyase transcriptional activator
MLIIPDVDHEKRFEPWLRWLREYGLRSYCAFPLTTSRTRLGALGFSSTRVQGFSSQDMEFLRRAAEIVAVCLDKTLPPGEAVREKERLRLRLELEAVPERAEEPEQNIATILEILQRWAGQDYVGVYVYDDSSGSLRLRMREPRLAEKMAPQGAAPLEGSLAGQTFRNRQAVVLCYSELAQIPFDSVRRGLQLGVKSLCLVPLVARDRPLGVLKIAQRSDREFPPQDVALLKEVASSVARHLERSGEVRRQERTRQAPAESCLGEMLAISDLVGNAWLKKLAGAERTGPELDDRIPAAQFSEAEQLLTSYFSFSTAGFCIVDRSLRYLAINDALAAINGFPAQAHLGKTIQEILGDFSQNIEPPLHRLIESGRPILNLEINATLPTRNEPGHWVVHYFPIKNAAGEVMQIGAVVMETTEQKKLEASLRALTGKLHREKRRLEVLLETGHLLAANWDVINIFPKISSRLRRVLLHEFAALALLDAEQQMLVTEVMDFPLGRHLTAGVAVSAVSGPAGDVLRTGASLILSRDEMEAAGCAIIAGLVQEGLRSLCLAPLCGPRGCLGVFMLGSTRDGAFTPDDLPLVTQVAAQLAVALENAQAAKQIEEFKDRLTAEKRYLEGEIRTQQNFEEIIGESAELKQVLHQVGVVAESDATVLILGETGTGKELIARAIHRTSRRKDQSFVKLNCAAIPTGLLESELFGHEKGAFTGAISQKIGRLELADQGTLFLDEIGEIPLELQPKLLRVLQDQEFERLGGTRTIKVNLRLIAATNRDLARSVSAAEFRSDLFYRLNVFPIRMPSLRERRSDLPMLVRYLVQKYARSLNRQIDTIPTEAMDALMNWHWPGNVRELENLIERSVILSPGSTLRVPLSEFRFEQQANAAPDHTLENAEREHIISVLREAGGLVSGPLGAARRLGLKRTTLQSKMKKLNISRADYLGPKQR